MENKIVIILVLVCLVIGGVAGILFQIMQDSPKIEAAKVLTAKAGVADILKSKAINAVVVFGQVKSIQGKVVTLSYYGEDETQVLINDDAEITLVDNSKDVPSQSIAKFSDIKVGDGLNISATMSGDYKLLGTSVVLFPADLAQ